MGKITTATGKLMTPQAVDKNVKALLIAPKIFRLAGDLSAIKSAKTTVNAWIHTVAIHSPKYVLPAQQVRNDQIMRFATIKMITAMEK